MSERVAAIDCGTNTIKLFIGSPPHAEVRETRMVRLGEGVDTSGELSEAALARTFAAIDDYAALLATHPASRFRFCATSATRDARNGSVFAVGVEARLGVAPEVLSGEEEARLAFDGAVRNHTSAPVHPVLVVDIGGGSTELILGDAGGPTVAHSMDIGSVRLHERRLRTDPPSADEVAACVADIDAALDASPVDIAAAATVVGVAGTVTTLGAGHLDLPAYDADVVDQTVVPVAAARAQIASLVAMPLAERLELPYLHPGRADVIDAGVLILDRVLARAVVDSFVVSVADILDGIAWSIA
ncbi:MAG: Ppx/GppA phosphatase family protein [Nocardioides sp.]